MRHQENDGIDARRAARVEERRLLQAILVVDVGLACLQAQPHARDIGRLAEHMELCLAIHS